MSLHGESVLSLSLHGDECLAVSLHVESILSLILHGEGVASCDFAWLEIHAMGFKKGSTFWIHNVDHWGCVA